MSAEEKETAWIGALREALRTLPNDYQKCHDDLRQLRSQFHNELARAFEPRLNQELNNRPQFSYDDKRELAHWLNQDTRDLGLAVRSPEGHPATIVANYRDNEHKSSRFRIVPRSTGPRCRETRHDHLTGISLREDVPRREPLIERFKSNHNRMINPPNGEGSDQKSR